MLGWTGLDTAPYRTHLLMRLKVCALKTICLHGGAALNHWRIPCRFNSVCLNLNLMMNVRWKIFLLAACQGTLRWLAGNSRWPCYQQYRLPLSQYFSVPVSCVSVEGFFCLTPGFSDSWWWPWESLKSLRLQHVTARPAAHQIIVFYLCGHACSCIQWEDKLCSHAATGVMLELKHCTLHSGSVC